MIQPNELNINCLEVALSVVDKLSFNFYMSSKVWEFISGYLKSAISDELQENLKNVVSSLSDTQKTIFSQNKNKILIITIGAALPYSNSKSWSDLKATGLTNIYYQDLKISFDNTSGIAAEDILIGDKEGRQKKVALCLFEAIASVADPKQLDKLQKEAQQTNLDSMVLLRNPQGIIDKCWCYFFSETGTNTNSYDRYRKALKVRENENNIQCLKTDYIANNQALKEVYIKDIEFDNLIKYVTDKVKESVITNAIYPNPQETNGLFAEKTADKESMTNHMEKHIWLALNTLRLTALQKNIYTNKIFNITDEFIKKVKTIYSQSSGNIKFYTNPEQKVFNGVCFYFTNNSKPTHVKIQIAFHLSIAECVSNQNDAELLMQQISEPMYEHLRILQDDIERFSQVLSPPSFNRYSQLK